MVSWATDAANWTTIETELTTKGVKVGIGSNIFPTAPAQLA